MFKFLLFAVFASALVFQPSSSKGIPRNSPELQDSKDEVLKAFHDLLNTVAGAIDEAKEAVNLAVGTVKQNATDLKEAGKKAVDNVLEPFEKQIDKLVEDAKDEGVDITNCTQYVDDFRQIADGVLNCAATPLTNLQKYVDDFLDQLEKVEDEVNGIDKDIDACDAKDPQEKNQCFAECSVRIAWELEAVPVRIATDLAKTKVLIATVTPVVKLCIDGQVAGSGARAVKDEAAFVFCLIL